MVTMYTKLFLRCFNSGPFHKSGHKYFNRSGPLLQIRSHIIHTHIYIGVSYRNFLYRKPNNKDVPLFFVVFHHKENPLGSWYLLLV